MEIARLTDESWEVMCNSLRIKCKLSWRDFLLKLWTQDERRYYHNLQHLRECIALVGLDTPRVELALWFHDAIYDPRKPRESIAACVSLGHAFLVDCGGEDQLKALTGLIKVTDHATKMVTPEQRLICDIDLAILASNETRFDEYCEQIRQEYLFVPDDRYNDARKKVLKDFMRRVYLYHTPAFEGMKDRAVRNMNRALARL